MMCPPIHPPSISWGEDCDGQWWIVLMRDGEPHIAYHPLHGWVPAFRDSFRRWHFQSERP
jgi:hypothetical protein